MRRACARALSPRSFLRLEHSFQPTPSPLCGLASWPLLGACSMYPGKQFLTGRKNGQSGEALVTVAGPASDRAVAGVLGLLRGLKLRLDSAGFVLPFISAESFNVVCSRRGAWETARRRTPTNSLRCLLYERSDADTKSTPVLPIVVPNERGSALGYQQCQLDDPHWPLGLAKQRTFLE